MNWNGVEPPARLDEFLRIAKPGWLLAFSTGKMVWVGHINDVGGVCDDCTDEAMSRRSETRVIAYLDATLAVPELDTISMGGDDANV